MLRPSRSVHDWATDDVNSKETFDPQQANQKHSRYDNKNRQSRRKEAVWPDLKKYHHFGQI